MSLLPSGSLAVRLGCGRPIPRQQFGQPVDFVIMDTVEDVGEVSLRVEAVHLRGFDDRHGAGQGFTAGIGPGEEPVAAADPDRAHSTLRWIVVYGHAPVVEEQ